MFNTSLDCHSAEKGSHWTLSYVPSTAVNKEIFRDLRYTTAGCYFTKLDTFDFILLSNDKDLISDNDFLL